MIGLNSKVNYHGRIATIAELAGEELIVFRAEKHYGKFDKPAYFADLDNDGNGWQINKLAYDAAIKRYRNTGIEDLPQAEIAPPAPYTFAEKQLALVNKFCGTSLEWLTSVDFENWEVAYHWLMNSTMADIYHFAPVIESEHWTGTFPEVS